MEDEVPVMVEMIVKMFPRSAVACAEQGDYDGSGRRSCKCNYVDFHK